MVSPFDDLPFLQDQDLIRLFDGRDPVGNDHAGLFLEDQPESFEDLIFRLGIHAGETVIQDQDRAFQKQRTRQSRPLLLSPGQGNPPLSYDRIETLGKNFQIPIQSGNPDRFFDLLVRDAVSPKGQVAPERCGKEKRVLGHIGHGLPQFGEGERTEIFSANPNFSRGYIVEPGEELNQSAFSRSGPAYNRQRTTGG